MPNLVLRATGHPNQQFAYSLSIRRHESVGETEYERLCFISKRQANEVMRTGVVTWHGAKPWEEA
jgi:hypothetical protein